jgi:peptidoglycan/xylan/chitin deacetylase (PgdA/CDA1 family)
LLLNCLPLSLICCNCYSLRYRWIDYQRVDPITERAHIDATVRVHEELLGHHPSGIYQGKPNEETRRIICEEGKFLYDCDSYADELPNWNHDYGRPHLGKK